ncbi:MAG: hypothetical protein MUF49_03850 [Oculatellaceae cyanobacterium Prado106]|nr:hypothetical protein [Oculatellaceae cyanobacterium Prado106]
MFPLGHELQQREHRVTIFSAIEAQSKIEAAGFDFCDIYFLSNGTSQQRQTQAQQAGIFTNVSNIRNTLKKFAQQAEIRLQTTPDVIRERGVEALIVDLSVFEGGTIADYLNLPFVTMCCLLPFY